MDDGVGLRGENNADDSTDAEEITYFSLVFFCF